MYKSLASLVLFALTANAGLANAGICNTLPDPTTFADLTTADGSPSPSTGGDVTDGTYYLTSALVYNTGLPPGFVLATIGTTISLASSLAADMYESVSEPLGGPAFRDSGSVTFDSASATVTTTATCPAPGPPMSAGYSSDGKTVVVVADGGGGILVEETFVRQ